MEQLLLNKTERRKIYWWIYLSTLAACLLSTAIAVALAELPFVNEVIYEENSVPDKPVMTNAGQNLYMTVFYIMVLYYFLTRRNKERHFDKMLPIMVLLMAMPMQLIFYSIGLKQGLYLTGSSLLILTFSFLLGLNLKKDIARYRNRNMSILLIIGMAAIFLPLVLKTNVIGIIARPLFVILFAVLTLIEVQRMKLTLEKGIPEASFGNFYFTTIANIYVNFLGTLIFFDLDKIIYKLIVSDKDGDFEQ